MAHKDPIDEHLATIQRRIGAERAHTLLAWLRPAAVLAALAALPWALAIVRPAPLEQLLLVTAIILGLSATVLAMRARARAERRRHAREIARLSRTDPLTGLGTRGALERDLEPLVFRARRGEAPLALVRMDVDGLKQLNERYGQSCGDETLKHLGAVLRSSLRFGSDAAYRVGGDEFVAVVAADAPAAKAVAHRVARAFAERSPRGSHLKAEVVAWDGEARPFELLREVDTERVAEA